MKRIVSAIMLTLLLMSILSLTVNIKPVKSTWTGTIYIRADGSIDPRDAPISTVDNVTYILTGNIISNAHGIVVERDNIIIDGDGYALQGTGGGNGIDLSYRRNVTIKNMEIKRFECGIWLYDSSNNIISGNNITNNGYGIGLDSSSNNSIYHNNFINNKQVISYNSINTWDDGYPSGGNYWSDYTGVDLFSGAYQNETGSDGIGDTPNVIDDNNVDHYPLMGMFYDFEVVGLDNETYHVQIISNSTVTELNLAIWLSSPTQYIQPGQELLTFFVEGESSTSGFCRVTIPRALLNDSYIVLVDGVMVPSRQLEASNSAHTYLYFTYDHATSKQNVIIVPEFTLTTTLLAFTISTLIATALWKIKRKKLHKTSLSYAYNAKLR